MTLSVFRSDERRAISLGQQRSRPERGVSSWRNADTKRGSRIDAWRSRARANGNESKMTPRRKRRIRDSIGSYTSYVTSFSRNWSCKREWSHSPRTRVIGMTRLRDCQSDVFRTADSFTFASHVGLARVFELLPLPASADESLHDRLAPRQLMISVASNWQRISGHVLKERTAFGEPPCYETFGSVSAPSWERIGCSSFLSCCEVASVRSTAEKRAERNGSQRNSEISASVSRIESASCF